MFSSVIETGKEYINIGYVKVQLKNYPRPTKNNLYYKHRWIMEKQLGRLLNKDEYVHHINGNKLDNSLENLCLMTRQEHSRLHMTKSGSQCKLNKEKEICSNCGNLRVIENKTKQLCNSCCKGFNGYSDERKNETRIRRKQLRELKQQQANSVNNSKPNGL